MREPEHEFHGTDRFELISRLGDGGMGVVYEALDRERGSHVALKVLRTLSADSVLRFKHEFRSLQDLQHTNLVTLLELVEDQGRWFFTMELVDGIDLLAWVRPPRDPPARGRMLDERRLRGALVQLARGLNALHAAKKVHRDIKPSNVLVAADGRVVLVDFGLSADVDAERNTGDGRVVGTADYMAPEQAAAHAPSPEADWYSVGVMMYLALTGKLPFKGTPLGVLMDKQKFEPPAITGAPADLASLCKDLLRRDPRARPTGAEVLRRLGVSDEPARAAPAAAPFVGRARELELLARSLDETRRGGPVTVCIVGESGIGKSALVKRFTEPLGATPGGALVLGGRCHERELVPYKAFDGVVDALARHLSKLPKEEAAALLPARAALLGQVFPVLRGVEAVARAPLVQPSADPLEMRARVFAAVRELLSTLAAKRPLVIVIDDLQWADRDSLALLAEVVRPPEAPPLLIVATERRDQAGAVALPGTVRRLELGALPPDEARQLATLLGGRLGAERTLTADEIATETGGHPLFIDELVRHAAQAGAKGTFHLESAIAARVAGLEPPARHLVELVAVAGAPLRQEICTHAANMDPAEFGKRTAALRTANLVRTSGARGADTIEPYHDRVRAAILARLDSTTLIDYHERLALALGAARHADPEALCVHWLGAGDLDRAAHYAGLAADQASTALAFERASRLYKLSLELEPRKNLAARRAKLGDALAQSGRGGEAARELWASAEASPPVEALDLRRRAAEQLLRAGHVAEGTGVLETVLGAVGMKLAASPQGALRSLVWRRLQLRVRGLSFRERSESELPPDVLRRIDVCWSAAIGLAWFDTIRGADFQTRHLLLALGAGEPYRIARALAFESAAQSLVGGPGQRRAARLNEQAMQLAERLADRAGQPHALGMASLTAGMSAFLGGRWKEAHRASERAVEIIAERCLGAAWELHNAHYFALVSLAMLGELGELQRRVPRLRAAADERGDLFAGARFRVGLLNLAALAADEPARARDEIAQAMQPWPESSAFQLQHYSQLVAEMQTDLYEGHGGAALERIEAQWPRFSSALVLRTQFFRVEAHDLRARAALAAAARLPDGAARTRLLDLALADAATIARERMPWATPIAQLVRAAVAGLRGESGAAAEYEAAERAFAAADMALHAACARRRRGQLLGGDEGRRLTSDADGWLAGQQVKKPERMTALLAP